MTSNSDAAGACIPEVGSDVSVSAVVCAYNDARRELLDNSIEAILAQLGAEDQLVVVIDFNDELFDRISAQYGSRAKVVPNANERGICGARNSGIEASNGDVVAFVDDDAQVQPGWLEGLRENYRNPVVAGVGGNAQPVWPIERPPWFPSEFDWVVGCSHRGLPVDPTPVRNLLGCNMSFRRTALDNVGGFNSAVGQVGTSLDRCDETELCIRLNQKSPASLLLLDPGVKVRHWVSDERTRPGYFLRRCFWEGLSKQRLSAMVGSSDALSTERKYTFTVLPMGFARGLLESVKSPGKRLAFLGQSAALVVGLTATTFGYLYSLMESKFRRK
ncbi:MAG: glycosyltransferase [Actinomycetia bacterium]|nr:glycosyltransferase [Actinomycetes bacterium]